MGRTEARILGEWKFRNSNYSRKSYYQAHLYSGIFPVEVGSLSRFAECYRSALANLDILAFWPTEFQAALVRDLAPRPILVERLALEPFLWPDPWSEGLSGKKVLVVHPFKESILHQYNHNRSKLFEDPRVLPEFDLQVIRAPQCAGGQLDGFSSWFQAFEYLKSVVLASKFDVAIVGCGAFGLPLTSAIKRSGRKALHLAGATQLLFGVTGKRWLQHAFYKPFFNEYWCRPLESDLTPSRELIDEACYW